MRQRRLLSLIHYLNCTQEGRGPGIKPMTVPPHGRDTAVQRTQNTEDFREDGFFFFQVVGIAWWLTACCRGKKWAKLISIRKWQSRRITTDVMRTIFQRGRATQCCSFVASAPPRLPALPKNQDNREGERVVRNITAIQYWVCLIIPKYLTFLKNIPDYTSSLMFKKMFFYCRMIFISM